MAVTGTVIFFVIFIGIILFFYIAGTLEERRQKNAVAQGIPPAAMDWAVLLSDEIQQYLPDQKIVAIKRYREMTGVGLKEAKDAIEYALAHPDHAADGLPTKRKDLSSTPAADFDWNVLLSPEMKAYLPNRKIEAIKLYRERTGVGLKEAKDAIDDYFAHPDDVPAKIRRFDLSGQQAAGIRDLLREGKRAEAQKIYQAFMGVDQFTASEAIDALEREVQDEASRSHFGDESSSHHTT